jgi:hypothetical protein
MRTKNHSKNLITTNIHTSPIINRSRVPSESSVTKEKQKRKNYYYKELFKSNPTGGTLKNNVSFFDHKKAESID